MDPNKSSVGYIRYTPQGLIKSWGQVATVDLSNQTRPGFNVLEVPIGTVSYKDKYVDVSGGPENHVVADKPVMPISIDTVTIRADGVEKATVTGIPVGAKITIDDVETIDVNDGVFEFTAVINAAVKLDIQAFPFLPEEITIIALDTV